MESIQARWTLLGGTESIRRTLTLVFFPRQMSAFTTRLAKAQSTEATSIRVTGLARIQALRRQSRNVQTAMVRHPRPLARSDRGIGTLV